jgi:WhiB family redox-sensing transcriptional regulator
MSPEQDLDSSARMISEIRASYIGSILLAKDTPGWRKMADCRGMDPRIFFPVKDSDSDQGLAICADCRVWVDCLKFAIKNHELNGIWGGCTEDQRRTGTKRSTRIR